MYKGESFCTLRLEALYTRMILVGDGWQFMSSPILRCCQMLRWNNCCSHTGDCTLIWCAIIGLHAGDECSILYQRSRAEEQATDVFQVYHVRLRVIYWCTNKSIGFQHVTNQGTRLNQAETTPVSTNDFQIASLKPLSVEIWDVLLWAVYTIDWHAHQHQCG